ncbi:MAG TPA: hypothetical protein VNV86_20110, partial [Candidatus Acidoferrum sp.]|nr:hypothetical protein [Candidatus Acidoferrum sp.]
MRIIVLAGFLVWAASAQSLTTDPPPILQIVRKPGTAVTVRPYSKAEAMVNAIGLRSVTGPPETWMLEAHYSFASVEDLDQRLAGTRLSDEDMAPPVAMIGLYRPAWSFRPAEAIRLLGRAR